MTWGLGVWRSGTSLSSSEWGVRHRWIVRGALWQALVLALATGALGHGRGPASLVLVGIGLPAALAARPGWPARVRTVLATLSLTAGAAVLVPVTGQGEAFSWMLLAIAVCALYQDWVIVPTAVVVALVDFAVVVFGPKAIDPYDLLPVVATLAVCLVHHRTWRLAEDGARTDPLTGLGNRRRLAEATARLLRADDPLSVLFLDLDGFKAVNDSRGHGIGDALLVEVADRLRAGVRADDLVVRLGGDEFAVLVPGPRRTRPRSPAGCRPPSGSPCSSPADPCRSPPASASPARPRPDGGTPTCCCATPTWRCTRPRPPVGTRW